MSIFAKKHQKDLNPESISEALLVASELKLAIAENDEEKLEELESKKGLLLMLLEHILNDSLSHKIDPYLLDFLLKYFGIKLPKAHEFSAQYYKEEEKKKKAEQELLHRLIIYEIYKILCPNKLAGETEIDNFINNTRTHGRDYAIKHAEPDFKKLYIYHIASMMESSPTSSNKKSFVDLVDANSKTPSGRNF